MQFRTEIKVEASSDSINHKSKLMMMGSCFTENIGEKLKRYKFDIDVNPFGILFNPSSIVSGLQRILDQAEYNSDDLFEFNGLWHSYDHHGAFSAITADKSLEAINLRLRKGCDQLQNADYLFITLGSAWCYVHLKEDRIVANCHKVTGNLFKKELLDASTIQHSFTKVIASLQKLNENLKIVFTVSPVRHWKDGAIDNQLSKSTLIVAAHQLAKQFDQVSYFPAYELIMDDLRDYRYYKEDMLHPNMQAVEYVWEKFSEVYFTAPTQNCITELNQLLKALEHRPINPESEANQQFKLGLLEKIKGFEERTGIDMQKQLIKLET